jgi:hypothetical protein
MLTMVKSILSNNLKPKRMSEREKATRILFYLLVFTICIFALSVLALAYVYVHPTISLG